MWRNSMFSFQRKMKGLSLLLECLFEVENQICLWFFWSGLVFLMEIVHDRRDISIGIFQYHVFQSAIFSIQFLSKCLKKERSWFCFLCYHDNILSTFMYLLLYNRKFFVTVIFPALSTDFELFAMFFSFLLYFIHNFSFHAQKRNIWEYKHKCCIKITNLAISKIHCNFCISDQI